MFAKILPVLTMALACLPGTAGVALSAGQKPGENAPPEVEEPAVSLDYEGRPLPPRALVRLGTTRMRHAMATVQLAASPDGKMLASTGFGPALRLSEIATGKVRHEFPLLQRSYFATAFSPDSKLLAVNNFWDKSFQGPCLLDTGSGKELRRFEVEGNSIVIRPVFSPDGKLVAGGLEDNSIAIWDVATGKQVRRLTGPERTADTLAFSPDGRILVSGGYDDKVIRLWDPNTGTEVAQLTGHRHSIKDLRFSSDGRRLASLGDSVNVMERTRGIRLWDVANRRQIGLLTTAAGVTCMARSGDGKLLAGGNQDGSITLWDFGNGRELRHFRAHAHPVGCLSFAGKTLASTGAMESAVRLWDAGTGNEIRPQPVGHAGAVEFLRFTQRGDTLLSVGRDQTTRTWDWASGRQREVSTWPSAQPLSRFVVSADGTTLLVQDWPGKKLVAYDLASRKQLAELQADGLYGYAASPEGKLLAWSDRKGVIRIWDVKAKKERQRLKEKSEDVHPLVFSPNGVKLASASRSPVRAGTSTLRLWDVVTGREHSTFVHEQGVCALAFSADGKTLATVDSEGPARLWDTATGRHCYILEGSRAPFQVSIAFSPDGRWFALGGGPFGSLVGGNGAIGVWETITGKAVVGFQGHAGGNTSLAFGPDSRILASGGSEGSILVWDVAGTRKRQPKALMSAEVENLWNDLAGNDAAKAQRAIWRLTGNPSPSLGFLRKRLHPAAPAAAGQVRHMIAGLDSDRFALREKAYGDLSKLADLAEPALRRAATGNLSLETRRRIEQLLTDLHRPVTASPLLQALRAVAVLEYIGTSEARHLLLSLANGTPEARVTKEALAACKRSGG